MQLDAVGCNPGGKLVAVCTVCLFYKIVNYMSPTALTDVYNSLTTYSQSSYTVVLEMITFGYHMPEQSLTKDHSFLMPYIGGTFWT